MYSTTTSTTAVTTLSEVLVTAGMCTGRGDWCKTRGVDCYY